MTQSVLKSPFPAFGGKSQVAALVWERLGDPRNFIEPFAFSAAMLLRRPTVGAIETINDLNAFVSNFWRSIQRDPEAVAAHADWPVNETDLHARHKWLVQSETAQGRLQQVRDDPEFFDAKLAGWWCWGACCWIGGGWCSEPGDGRGRTKDGGVVHLHPQLGTPTEFAGGRGAIPQGSTTRNVCGRAGSRGNLFD